LSLVKTYHSGLPSASSSATESAAAADNPIVVGLSLADEIEAAAGWSSACDEA